MFKKVMSFLVVLSVAIVMFCFAPVGEAADDIALTSVKIVLTPTSQEDTAILSYTTTPSNANGTFKHSWSSSNSSIASVSAIGDGSRANLKANEKGEFRITLTVTQTMPSGATITRTDYYDDEVVHTGLIEDSGCNTAGWSVAVMLLVLPFLFRRQNVKHSE